MWAKVLDNKIESLSKTKRDGHDVFVKTIGIKDPRMYREVSREMTYSQDDNLVYESINCKERLTLDEAKEMLISEAKSKVNEFMSEYTDWMMIRKVRTGEEIPKDITLVCYSIIDDCNEFEKEIDSINNVEGLQHKSFSIKNEYYEAVR